MATLTTPALVLHVIPYGDTSKILKLLTRDQGLISVIARGARRNRSRTGPRLDLFTTGVASVAIKQQRDLQVLTAFEADEGHGDLGRDVGRFAAAAALAEIALRCSSHDTSPDVFDAARAGLIVIADAAPGWEATGALVACWGLVAALGFTPVLDRCVVCDAAIDATLHFSAAQGGAVCARHRGGGAVSNLSGPDRVALAGLTAGRMPAVALDERHAAAHRRLLLGFVRYHLAEQRAMPALAFWDSESWNDT